MSLTDFLQRYTDDVYMTRNPEAARSYIADPCLRHEHGHLVTMSIEENVASAYNITFGNGDAVQTVSGVEIFRVVNGKITETWNSSIQPGAWG